MKRNRIRLSVDHQAGAGEAETSEPIHPSPSGRRWCASAHRMRAVRRASLADLRFMSRTECVTYSGLKTLTRFGPHPNLLPAGEGVNASPSPLGRRWCASAHRMRAERRASFADLRFMSRTECVTYCGLKTLTRFGPHPNPLPPGEGVACAKTDRSPLRLTHRRRFVVISLRRLGFRRLLYFCRWAFSSFFWLRAGFADVADHVVDLGRRRLRLGGAR